MRRLGTFLTIALVSMLALLAGLSWDALLHGNDSTLAAREGLFTLANPGHVLLLSGIAGVVLGLAGAGYTALSLTGSPRWSTPRARAGFAAVTAAVLVASAGTTGWAAIRSHDHGSSHDSDGSHDDAAATHDDGHDTATAGDWDDAVNRFALLLSGGEEHAHPADSAPPTPQQRTAAARLHAATKAGIAKYETPAAARAAGYRAVTPPELPVVHYLNFAYLADTKAVDPSAVESLVYLNSTEGPRLLGAMYMMSSRSTPGPRIGGSLTQWHTHENLCLNARGVVGLASGGRCPQGSVNAPTPEMLHVWSVDVVGGPFAEMDAAMVRSLLRL